MYKTTTSYVTILLLIATSSWGSESFAPFEGSQRNDYGEIAWKSSVTQPSQSSQNWQYRQEIWNNDTQRNCRVNWIPVGLESTIPPGKSVFNESHLPSRPMEKSGELRLRGGSASGEFVIRNARAWMPEGGELALSSTTRVFADLEANGDLTEIELTTHSTLSANPFGSKTLVFELSVRGISPARLGHDVVLSWNFPQLGDVEFLSFDGEGRSRGSIVTIDSVEPRVGAVTILDSDGQVLAKTTAPAIVPTRSDVPVLVKMEAPPGLSSVPEIRIVELSDQEEELDRLVGKWTYVNRLWPVPSASPVEGTGTMHATRILDGQVVQMTWYASSMGMRFEGRETEVYNHATKQYVSTWVDNMGGGIQYRSGTCKDNVCTKTGDLIDPVSGRTITATEYTIWINDDSFKRETYVTNAEGQVVKTMELTAKRRAEASGKVPPGP